MPNSSLSSLLTVLFIYLFLMVVLCICKRRFPRYRQDESALPTVGDRLSLRGNRGLKPAIIQTFPTFQYSVVKELKFGKGALECAVCLNEFQHNETIRLLPKCDHVFHLECIDVWLFNRTTCPVCRANLVPESAETNAITSQPIQDDFEEELEILDEENQQVSIHVISEEEPPREVAVDPEVIDPVQIQMQNGRLGKFPRSHSTGHSLAQPGEDIERFTLRLPDDVRKQIMKKRLNRTSSMGLLPTVRSSRRGYRMSGEGSSRGGREGWVFSMMPSFFMRRASPARSPKMTAEGDATVTPPPTPPPAKPFWSPLRG